LVKKLHWVLLLVVGGVLVWSGISPHDYFTWFLEVFPVLVGIPLLIFTYHRFRLTDLTYFLIAIHAVILMVGGHYTYALVPAGNWLRDALDLSRNHYDRLGHFAQGFIPAIIAREIFIRTSPLKGSKWLGFIVVCFCVAFSACYELLEWATAALSGTAAEAFLGTQGDVWDTQKDMALALIGAIFALLTLSNLHDRQLSQYNP
jgi:putative membrane protein